MSAVTDFSGSALLLRTRLTVPPLRRTVVPRDALLAALNRQPDRSLTLISAPAGFGKTTLTQTWLGTVAEPVGWYSISADDNDPMQFLSYLVAAIESTGLLLASGLKVALQSPQPPPVQALFIHLANELAAAGQRFVLVLDDLHLVNMPALLDGLSLLIEQTAGLMHLVILTREDPPMPLARYRARGELVELRAADLRFGPEETARFFRDVLALSLDDAARDALIRRTEGWPVGLQLAGLALRDASDASEMLASFSGSHRFVLDYLSEEVLNGIAPDLRQFLFDTAMLDQLSGPLCDAVTGRSDSAEVLRQLDAANLFVFPLDNERVWYRYHHLFAELLQKQRGLSDDDHTRALHARASRWLAAAGRSVEAANHALASGDGELMGEIVSPIAFANIKRGYVSRARRWLSQIPDDVLDRKPDLRVAQIWVAFLENDLSKTRALADHADAMLAQHPDSPDIRELRGQVRTVQALVLPGDPHEMRRLAGEALSLVGEDSSFVRGIAHMARANAHMYTGDARRGLVEFSAAIRPHWQAGNHIAAMIAVMDGAQAAMSAGTFSAAMENIAQVRALVDSEGLRDVPVFGLVETAEAAVQLQRGRPAEAVPLFRAGLARLKGGAPDASMRFASLMLAEALALTGNTPDARQQLAVLDAQLADLPAGLREFFGAWLTNAHLLLGEEVETVPFEVDPDTRSIFLLFQQLTAIRVRLLQGGRKLLTGLTSELQDFVSHTDALGLKGLQTDAMVMLAVAHQRSGHADAANRALREALALATPEGHALPFLRVAADLAAPLQLHANGDGAEAQFARQILETLPGGIIKPSTFSHPELVESLGEREIDVLRHMTAGLTYQDIADTLFISVNTVRYHVKGLYGKLGVSSRAEAIARARELGLLG